MSDTPTEIHPLKIADFRFYWLARFMAVLATMGMVVVIGYQAYDIARSDYGMSIREASLQLGLLGLVQFVPLAASHGCLLGRLCRRLRLTSCPPHPCPARLP